MTTKELDATAAQLFTAHGARSAPALIYGFPGTVLISVNDEVVHGIPSGRHIRTGDTVKIDVTVEKDGYVADAARSVVVEPASATAHRWCSPNGERGTLFGSLFGLAVPVIHMKGPGGVVGGEIGSSSEAFFFVWTLLALGVTSAFSAVLAARGLWGLPWPGPGNAGVARPVTDRGPRPLAPAKDRMAAASHEEWPVGRLASVSGVPEAHFARSFKDGLRCPAAPVLRTRSVAQDSAGWRPVNAAAEHRLAAVGRQRDHEPPRLKPGVDGGSNGGSVDQR